jgi:hypothetical protein
VNHFHVSWKPNTENLGRDKILAGTWARGERVWSSRLTAAKVRQIHRAAGLYSAVAKRFGVSPSTVAEIKRGDSWKHLNLTPLPDPSRTKRRSRQG